MHFNLLNTSKKIAKLLLLVNLVPFDGRKRSEHSPEIYGEERIPLPPFL